jgi:hypothetical protein
MKRGFLSAAIFASLAGATSPLAAQGLSAKIGELIKFGTCDQALCLVTGGGTHGSHFIESAQGAGADLLSFLTSAITTSVSSLPIGSTTSGTTFSFVGGAPVQNKTSAGPIFAERASTLGKGRILAGVNTSHIGFSKLRGISTDSIDINLGHQDVGAAGLGDPSFENDVIGIVMDMKLTLQVTTLFATYGLSDKLDVSVAIPFVMSSLDGSADGRIFSPTGSVSGFHFFGTAESPNLTATSAVDGSASGIGDIALRAKMHLAGTNSRGIAFLADVRVPTGDEQNFHGAGKLSASGILIASSTNGNFSHHANVGYASRTGEGQNNAILATLGFDYMLSKAATVAVDLLSQMQAGGTTGKLPATIPITGNPISGTNIPDKKDNPIGLSAGGRFLLGDFTVLANGLVPIKSGGLQSKFIWTLGVERTF